MGPPKQQSFISRALISLGLAKVKASLLVVGLANSGKTSLVNVLKADRTAETAPTVGFAVEKFSLLKTKLTVLDMSGQQRYQRLWECYYQDVQGVLFVVDAADKHVLVDASLILSSLLGHADLEGTPLLVYANKMDLLHALPASELALQLNLASIADRAWQIAACSAATGEGVEGGISWLLEQIHAKMRQRRPSRMAPDSAGSSFSSVARARAVGPDAERRQSVSSTDTDASVPASPSKAQPAAHVSSQHAQPAAMHLGAGEQRQEHAGGSVQHQQEHSLHKPLESQSCATKAPSCLAVEVACTQNAVGQVPLTGEPVGR